MEGSCEVNEDIIKILIKSNPSPQEMGLVVSQHIALEKKINPKMVLRHAMDIMMLQEAYKSSKKYFFNKWHLTILKTDKKVIIIDSWNGNIYM